MMTLNVLVLTAALSASGDTVLLEFSADWCGNCRLMAPTVQRLEDAGYPVRRVNVDRERELAERFRIAELPCFVLVHQGREVDRLVGAASYDRLVQLFAAAQPARQSQLQPAEHAKHIPAAAPVTAQRREARGAIRAQSPDQLAGTATTTSGQATAAASAAESDPVNTTEAAALASSVRIKVIDPNGASYGSGTIIDTHGAEALVVTCGHLFRESQGKGEILVELLAPESSAPVRGQLIAYDADHRDIALLAIRPEIPVTAARVAADPADVQAGAPVFSIGCDHGGPSRIIRSHIAAVDKYTNAPNIVVAGQPVDGRSGGGLFTSDGRLIGICNAADPADDEGIYAGLPSIHWQLDEVGLSRIYRPASDALVAAPHFPAKPNAQPATQAEQPPHEEQEPELETFAQSSPAPTPLDPAAANLLAAIDQGQEVICIVRTPNQKDARVLILDRTSQDLLTRLARETAASNAPHTPSLQTYSSSNR